MAELDFDPRSLAHNIPWLSTISNLRSCVLCAGETPTAYGVMNFIYMANWERHSLKI